MLSHRSEKLLQIKKDEKQLTKMMESSPGGWREAERVAREHWETACRENPSDSTASDTTTSTSSLTNSTTSLPSPISPQPTLKSAVAEEEISVLRHRTSLARRHEPLSTPETAKKSNEPQEGIETLTWHPKEEISKLAISIAEEKEFLTSSGPQANVFPNNVGFGNFIDYLLIPTLVYELEYPRTKTCVFCSRSALHQVVSRTEFGGDIQDSTSVHPRESDGNIRDFHAIDSHRRTFYPSRHALRR